ncbi:MAG TPA: hypothetical protein VFV34_15215 [Blastocatellia bacterium]|nr:hypothetical protein [Blastocatellia bacterium]
MRRIAIAVGLLTVTLLLSVSIGDACGDKSLRIGRGARFRRAGRPAAVLIYMSPNAPWTAIDKAAKLEKFLRTEGKHKVRIVQGADQLSEALGSTQYDVVLSNLAEAGNVQKQVASSGSAAAVVPIILKATKPEVAAAQKQYRYLVKDANSGEAYLDAIEGATRLRTIKA